MTALKAAVLEVVHLVVLRMTEVTADISDSTRCIPCDCNLGLGKWCTAAAEVCRLLDLLGVSRVDAIYADLR